MIGRLLQLFVLVWPIVISQNEPQLLSFSLREDYSSLWCHYALENVHIELLHDILIEWLVLFAERIDQWGANIAHSSRSSTRLFKLLAHVFVIGVCFVLSWVEWVCCKKRWCIAHRSSTFLWLASIRSRCCLRRSLRRWCHFWRRLVLIKAESILSFRSRRLFLFGDFVWGF